MGHPFSSIQRSRYFAEMESESYDVLVIGGGITGAGILLDAKARGLKAGLIEMNDFAYGTSSRSTKLIHGGLRYLKQLEVKLVAEVGKERAIVFENAPHLTQPTHMLLPIFSNGTFAKQAISLALKMYDSIANVKRQERRKMLTVKGTIAKEPLLRSDRLKGAGLYVEYVTDDSRLVIEIIKEAVSRGAHALNYVKATELVYDENHQVCGVKATCMLTGETKVIDARRIVNATGPWVDSIQRMDNPEHESLLELTKGVHLVIQKDRLPIKQAIYVQAIDGRMIFAIPKEHVVYIGTTDSFYREDIGNPKATKDECLYLLESMNDVFPNAKLSFEDIVSSWAGLRPLIKEKGKSPSEISRKAEMVISPSHLITIAGGKLTGYRKMAEKVVDILALECQNETGQTYNKCTTDKIELSGGKMGGSSQFPIVFNEQVLKGMALGLTTEAAERLVKRYGVNVKSIYYRMCLYGDEADYFHLPVDLFSELVYGIEEEMVVRPEDFFIRRTSALYFDIDTVEKYKNGVLHYMAHRFHWSIERIEKERQSLEQRMKDAKVNLQ